MSQEINLKITADNIDEKLVDECRETVMSIIRKKYEGTVTHSYSVQTTVTKDYRQRLYQEFSELCERINKLAIFIEYNETFKSLPVQKRNLMEHQLHSMWPYRFFLKERLEIEKSEMQN